MAHPHLHSHAAPTSAAPVTPLAARIVVGMLAAIGVAVIAAVSLWPSQQKVDIPMPFQNASGGSVTTVSGHVTSTGLGDCGSRSAGQVFTSAPLPGSPGSGQCVQSLVAIDSGPNTGANTNCSVGSLTHGFRTLDEVIDNDDVQALLASGWVDPAGVTALPIVTERPESITYSPLASCTETPTVVLVRLNARGLMTVKDAVPDLPVEGKPQCHVVAIAKEQGRVAASVGCALSRARTGMRVDEATCVFPAETLPALVGELERHAELDSRMAHYAADDARRFTTPQPGVPGP